MKYRYRLLSFGLACLACLAPRSSPAFELHGFADVSYHHDIHDDAAPQENNGAFALGPVDLYVAESIGPRLDVLTEIAFESGIVDLERLQIGYLFSDALKVYVGRFHSPLGYWNTAYHHGAFLHTTIQRPLFLNFEDDGGILPVHTVGLMLSGRRFSAAGELSYNALVGNGSSIIDEAGAPVLDPNNETDPNKNKAVGFRAAFAPARLRGWTVKPKRCLINRASSGGESDASVVSSFVTKAITDSDSLCARRGPRLAGSRPTRPARSYATCAS